MAELIIIGDSGQLKIIARSESGRARKYGLSISLNENNNQGGGSSLDVIDPEILELNTKNEALEGANSTLTESNAQLVVELKLSKNEALELNSKIEGLTSQLSIKVEDSNLKATEVAELITKCETIEDLKQYSTDARQVVVLAYKKKLKELG